MNVCCLNSNSGRPFDFKLLDLANQMCELRVASCVLRVACCELWVVNCEATGWLSSLALSAPSESSTPCSATRPARDVNAHPLPGINTFYSVSPPATFFFLPPKQMFFTSLCLFLSNRYFTGKIKIIIKYSKIKKLTNSKI